MTELSPEYPLNAILYVTLILLGLVTWRYALQDKERIRRSLILLTLFFALAVLIELLTSSD